MAEQAHLPQADPDTALLQLEDVVPLAAVIGAGCEPCATRMVGRALQHGSLPALERTLRILSGVAEAPCFVASVGPEVVERMKRSLRAGREAFAERGASAREAAIGESRPSADLARRERQ